MYNDEDNVKDNNVEDIEIVIGDVSNLEFSDVEDFMTDLKPVQEKKKNFVIPVAKKKEKTEKKDS